MVQNRKKSVVEYLMVVCVIGVVAIGAVRLLGGHVKDQTTRTYCDLLGRVYVAGDELGQSKCEK